MRVINSIQSLRSQIKKYRLKNKTIGFVPTMGALHQGHLSLIEKCRRENDITILSIYINPIQFNNSSDFKHYPRELKNDKKLAKQKNVDIIFYPSDKLMYPSGFLTYVEVLKLTDNLCGASREGHFRGVTTVVTKLLNLVLPDRLYLGQKDAQQAIIIKQMVADLNIPVQVKICPTQREKNGLALSSRNKLLSKKEKEEAIVLYQSLKSAQQLIRSGERQTKRIIQHIRSKINKNTSGKIDYIQCVDPDNLESTKHIKDKTLIALAVYFGQVRLIDNILVRIK